MKREYVLAMAAALAALSLIIGAMSSALPAISGPDAQLLVLNIDRIPYDIKTWSTVYDVIAVGKIVSIDTRVVDESHNSTNRFTGEPLHYEIKTPYKFVTIEVEKYIKDNFNSSEAQLTFRDETDGEVNLNGVKTFVKIEGGRGEYTVGDRAIFFMSKLDEGFTCDGYRSKFDIDSNSDVSSKYLREKGENPEPMLHFEEQILGTIKNLSVG